MILIDGDYIPYSACNGKRDFIQCIEYADRLFYSILRETKTDHYRLFFSHYKNFRKDISPTYKANRPPKPRYLTDTRNYMIDEYGGEVVSGYEADDLCGIYSGEDTIIVSPDKDLLQIPGQIVIPRRGGGFEWVYVTEWDAMRNFYIQMLCGDKTDNVEGVLNPDKATKKDGSARKFQPKFTPQTASELLAGRTVEEMSKIVFSIYMQQFKDNWRLHYETNKNLLWILRNFQQPNVQIV